MSFSKVRRETRATQAINGCHSVSSWCRRPRPADAPGDAAGLVAVEGLLPGAEPGQRVMQGGLVLLHLDQQGIVGFGGLCEGVLLTMQGIGGEQHAGQAQLGDQRRHGWDLARPPPGGPG